MWTIGLVSSEWTRQATTRASVSFPVRQLLASSEDWIQPAWELWQKLAETWIFYTCSGPQRPSLWDTIAASLVPVTAGVGVTFIWSQRRQFLKLLITYLYHLVLIWLRKNKSYLLFLKWHGETQNYFDINVKHIKIQTRKYLKARIQKKKCDARFFQRIWYHTPILKAISLFLKNKDQIKCSALLHAVTKYESIFMNNS